MASNLSRFRRWAKAVAEKLSPPPRMEITVQTDRVLIIRRKSRRVWCKQCGREVDSVGLQEAGRLSGPRQLALPGNVESEAWHVCAGGNSELVICLESLLKSMGNDAEVRNLIFKRRSI